MSLFSHYEERPPHCQAALVWFDTVDEIARYYSEAGYESTVKRTRIGVTLHLFHEPVEPGEKHRGHPGCDVSVEIPYDNMGATLGRQFLLYGHPPVLMDEGEFGRKYREAKELP